MPEIFIYEKQYSIITRHIRRNTMKNAGNIGVKFLVVVFIGMVIASSFVVAEGRGLDMEKTRDGGGLYLRVAVKGAPDTLNPFADIGEYGWDTIKWCFDGLTWRNASNNGHIEPWAAEWFHHGPQSTWGSQPYSDNDNNADYRNWTVKLRGGIKWHDWENQTGDDRFVRAHDVIFSMRLAAGSSKWSYVMEPLVVRNIWGEPIHGYDLPANGTIRLITYHNGDVIKLPYWVNLSEQKGSSLPVIYAWHDEDDLTMHFFTTYPFVDFPIRPLNVPIVPERIWKDKYFYTWSGAQALISFGQFKFNSSDIESLSLKTFRDYFHTEYDTQGNPKPYIDGIVFKILRNTDTAVYYLEKNMIDYIDWTIEPSYIADLDSTLSASYTVIPQLGFGYLGFNLKDEDFGYSGSEDSGKPLRIAISHLIDKETIVNQYLEGYGSVGKSAVSPTNAYWYNPNVKTYTYDIDKANSILDSYAPDTNGNGIRELPASGEDEIKLLSPPADNDAILTSCSMLIQNTLSAYGHLNVKTSVVSSVDYYLNTGNFQMFTKRMHVSDSLDSLYQLDLHLGRYDANYFGYHNSSFNELCYEMKSSVDANTRREAAFGMQEAIAEDVPLNVLFYEKGIYAYSTKWTGWYFPDSGTILNRESIKNLRTIPGSQWVVDVNAPAIASPGSNVDVTVTVTNKSSGSPVVGVEVQIKENGIAIANLTTDSNGRGTTTVKMPDRTSNVRLYAEVYDEGAKEFVSGYCDILVTENTPPESPRNIEIRAGDEYVEISWQPPVDNGSSPIVEYRIYRGDSAGNESFLALVDVSEHSYRDTDVENGKTYYYRVSAVNDDGLESELSEEVSATPRAGNGSTPGFEAVISILAIIGALTIFESNKKRG